jgi:hypothetical protein
MANPATTADIEARWRPLSAAEQVVAATRLDDAWRKLKRDIPDLEARMVGNADLTADVVRVLSDAVIRVLQNPEGIRRGTVSLDDASRTFDFGGDSTRVGLYFTDDEYADLSSTGKRRRARAFSVQPS